MEANHLPHYMEAQFQDMSLVNMQAKILIK